MLEYRRPGTFLARFDEGFRPDCYTGKSMSEAMDRDVVEGLFRAAHARDWTTMRSFYHSHAIEEWPQSGERLNGVDNITAVNENYSPHPGLQSKRILASRAG